MNSSVDLKCREPKEGLMLVRSGQFKLIGAVCPGRNLLVKDFCYLRTVNVPAAVRSLSGWNIGTKVALDE